MTGLFAEIALLTLSYAGDLATCKRLCSSVDHHMPGITHYLVVDRVDRPLFEPLAGPGRVILETETFLPELWQTSFMGRRIWLTPYGPPVRGWILQQLAKMAVTATLKHKVVVLIDSDAEFLRPLDPDRLLRDGRTRLYRAPGEGRGDSHLKWHRVAARVLGLPMRDYFGADYITTVVTWRPEVVRALLKHIRRTTWMPWRMTLSWRLRFSEYILYGVFADHVAGLHQEIIFHDDKDICHCSWHYDLGSDAGRDAFVANLAPAHAALLIQSNLKMPAAERDALADAVKARVKEYSV